MLSISSSNDAKSSSSRLLIPFLYYRIQNITFLIRCAINAVTVIPLITLLIPQAIIAVITFIINSN